MEELRPTRTPQLSLAKTDAELANEFRSRLVDAYRPLCVLLDEVVAAGMIANIQTGPDAFGKHSIIGFNIFKKM